MARDFRPALPGGVLWLDIATRMGWAYGSTQDGALHCGVMEMAPYDAGRADYYDSIYTGVADLCDAYSPSVFGYEAPLPTNIMNKKTREIRHVISNTNVIDSLRGGIAVARLAANHTKKLSSISYSNQTIRNHLMRGFPAYERRQPSADGRIDYKPIVMAWCHAVGFAPQDHNAADAIQGAEYVACFHFGRSFRPALA